MDIGWVVVLAVGVAAVAGVVGYVLGARRHGSSDGSVGTASTIAVLDSLVADGIGRLRSWITPARGSDEDPFTLAPDGTITLLFSDIAGSTRLNHDLGDARFAALLAKHDELVRRRVARAGGRVVKTQGDGFLAAFHEPLDGVRCALKLQDDLSDSRRVGTPLELRMGLHTGSAVTTDADVFGQNVAFAARVAGRADAGDVLVSEAVRERVEPHAPDVTFSALLFKRSLSGVPGRHRLSRIGYDED